LLFGVNISSVYTCTHPLSSQLPLDELLGSSLLLSISLCWLSWRILPLVVLLVPKVVCLYTFSRSFDLRKLIAFKSQLALSGSLFTRLHRGSGLSSSAAFQSHFPDSLVGICFMSLWSAFSVIICKSNLGEFSISLAFKRAEIDQSYKQLTKLNLSSMTDKATDGSDQNQSSQNQIPGDQTTANTTVPTSPQQPQGEAQTQGGGQQPQIPAQTVQNLPELS
jgi:hypothetical protein